LRLPPKLGCADYREALRSVKRLTELDFETCLFGHGDPVKSKACSKQKATPKPIGNSIFFNFNFIFIANDQNHGTC